VKFKREFIDFGEEFGYFALDWGYYEGVVKEEDADNVEGRPLVMVFSGLTASRIEPYIVKFFRHALHRTEWRVVLVNDRLYNNRFYLDPKRSALPKYSIINNLEIWLYELCRGYETHGGVSSLKAPLIRFICRWS
jgi:hypothetical protein